MAQLQSALRALWAGSADLVVRELLLDWLWRNARELGAELGFALPERPQTVASRRSGAVRPRRHAHRSLPRHVPQPERVRADTPDGVRTCPDMPGQNRVG
jgi:hypothetical protein